MTSQLADRAGQVPCPYPSSSSGDPVFVLCMGRSGSTLLRFLLDSHPVLACPPETNLPALCEQLTVVWSLIAGAPLSPNRGDAPPVIPDAAVAGVRRTLDMIINSYLARRGKQRLCDKSLGTARYAGLLLRVYPSARFLCLYRHPMDVIRSALDACPWGLSGYGFDSYTVASPGNSVLALARYWLDNAAMIAAVEDAHPDRCHRLRYEDLVEAPEEVTRGVFGFLGVPHVPGIAQQCFTDAGERFGPGDHKIWTTSAITTGSVGSGQSVPAGLVPPPVAEPINQLLDKLGYIQVNEDWGTPGMPADPRAPGSAGHPPLLAGLPAGTVSAVSPAAAPPDWAAANVARQLEARLRAGLTRIDDQFARRWSSCMTSSFLLVSRPNHAAGTVPEGYWLTNLATRALAPGPGDGEEPDWSIIGPPQVWLAVLAGEVNLSAAVRNWGLRYCDRGDAGVFAAQTRIPMLADLLGLALRTHAGTGLQETPQSAHTAAIR